tara:strand:+ start:21 stop:221 length:201 start_codon:yes stop_codon:yes gene_type:complete
VKEQRKGPPPIILAVIFILGFYILDFGGNSVGIDLWWMIGIQLLYLLSYGLFLYHKGWGRFGTGAD